MVRLARKAESHNQVKAWSWLSVASLESKEAKNRTSVPDTRSSPPFLAGSNPPKVMLSVPSGNFRHLLGKGYFRLF